VRRNQGIDQAALLKPTGGVNTPPYEFRSSNARPSLDNSAMNNSVGQDDGQTSSH
jgi:hypothetical protein